MERVPAQIATKSPPKIDDRKRLENENTPKLAIYKDLVAARDEWEMARNMGP
jgi:hypothetical protein